MAELMTRTRTEPASLQVYEPFRALRELMRWDPFRESLALGDRASAFVPSFEVRETPTAYTFKADLPGIKEDDLEVQLLGNRLTISGKRETEQREDNETLHLCERSYGSFSRSFTMPEEVSAAKVDAHLQNGVLTLMVMKSPEAQPRKVPVKT